MQSWPPTGLDYANLFRALGEMSAPGPGRDATPRNLFVDCPAVDASASRYRERLHGEGVPDAERRAAMNRVNPRHLLRNYLAQQAISAAEEADFSELHALSYVLSNPCTDQLGRERFAQEPPDWGRALAVSCSS